ncbi:MAG: hypothetical protein ABIJ92_03850 [Candidatus Aenigmatarchaeota archaeon]
MTEKKASPLKEIQEKVKSQIPARKINEYLKPFADVLFTKQEKKNIVERVYYLRIYAMLAYALVLMNSTSYKRAFNRLEILKNLTRNPITEKESIYVKHIDGLVRSIIKDKKKIVMRLKKEESHDPVHAKTRLQLAQNISIIRILKN